MSKKVLKLDVSPNAPCPIVVHDDIASADAHVVHVFDEIDIDNSKDLEAEIMGTDARQFIVIELSDCRYMDSSGITVLMRAYRHFGERLRIVVGLRSNVGRVISMLGLHGVLPLADSLEEALLEAAPAKAS